jgi:hypothetical protein
MKKLASIPCTITLILVVSATSLAGTISTTKSGIISTTKAGTIPTTRMGTIPTTRTDLNANSGTVPTTRSRTFQLSNQISFMELLWTVLGW